MSTYHTFRPLFSHSAPDRLRVLLEEITFRLDTIDRLIIQIENTCIVTEIDLPVDFQLLANMILRQITGIREVMPDYRMLSEEPSDDHVQMFRHDLIVPIQGIRIASHLLAHIAKAHHSFASEACSWPTRELSQTAEDILAILEALSNPKDLTPWNTFELSANSRV
jgi:hypothetical protein